MAKIALFGGAFNPVHIGHLTTILHVLELTNVDRILVAPVYTHPEGKKLTPFEDRLAMLRLALSNMPPSVVLDKIEEYNWLQGGRGLTINTLNILLGRGHEKILLVLGTDLKEPFRLWEGYAEIQALVKDGKVEIFWMDRDHTVSSTSARMAIKFGWSTKRMLQPQVREYIDQKRLY